MVQAEPNLLLTLKYLAPSGCTLSTEVVAALDHSIPIKRMEAGVQHLTLWGKVTARNGKDYLIAEGSNGCHLRDKKVVLEFKYYFSQNGTKWVDLPKIDDETRNKAGKIRTMLTGDPSHQYPVKDSTMPQPVKADGQDPEGDQELEDQTTAKVSELQRLRYMIEVINLGTAVMPCGTMVPDAYNKLVPNKLFSGIDYPHKLESYQHRHCPLDGNTLAKDLRGTWSLMGDAFRDITILRSLVYPGYAFYYNGQDCSWGGLYMGDGLRNHDLVFML